MKNYSRVCARIDLDAIEYNMEMMRQNLDEGVKIRSEERRVGKECL